MDQTKATPRSSTPSLPDWPRAHGAPLFTARLRSRPEDFQVAEQLGWEPSGDGEHDYLWVEKTGANTEWVSRQLAQYADVPARDVGYAGLKDRHAVTRQWFSVPRWHAPDWTQLEIDGVRIVDTQRHLRKLRRGAHKANSFHILLRCEQLPDRALIDARIATIRAQGVPNYYGEQRFGRHGSNLRLADEWAAGKRLPRHKRSLAISAMRSFLFNHALAERVAGHHWNGFKAGDLANLDGSNSVFDVTAIDDELLRRCAAMDIHPAGILAGDGSDIEPTAWQRALDKARVKPGHRSYRLMARDMTCETDDAGLTVRFSLDRGAFATAVLRELCCWS